MARMRIMKLTGDSRKGALEALLGRSPAGYSEYEETVRQIIEDVRARGDEAVFELEEKFDRCRLDRDSIRVSRQEIEEAYGKLDPAFVEVIRRSAANIRAYHEKQVTQSWITTSEDGTILGQKVTPIETSGCYVPGGRAVYPSSVLMNVIPAKVAGVERIVIATPPDASGKAAAGTIVAADIAGADEIYKVGGAQAIAALAYGTETIPRVDKITGPGNIFVALAKKACFGVTGIDSVAGPSEILVIADGKNNPVHVAADLLSQAEHDKLASAVLVTDSEELAVAVQAELERQIPLLPRAEIARESIDRNGKIIVAKDLMQGMEISNAIAPEHLELMVDDPFAYLSKIENAGSVFMGRNCPEALGDYFAGPNHTLPTSGTARFSSALSVDDFVKKSQYTYYTKDALGKIAEDIAYFARQEGLEAHARSALIRTKD